jgi:hypothetical protein
MSVVNCWALVLGFPSNFRLQIFYLTIFLKLFNISCLTILSLLTGLAIQKKGQSYLTRL